LRTAAALIIGTELLSGKIADQNLIVLARTLRSLGVRLERVAMILDEVDTIAGDVRELAAEHDVVFTSGGVGPTHDDVTIEAIARAFDVPVVSSPLMEKLLASFYGERLTDGHLLMARMPEGARCVTTGPSSPWPTVVMKNVWILPGIPEIFAKKMALVEADLGVDVPFVSRAVFTRLDEGLLKPHIDAIVAAFPNVEVGSYPRWDDPAYKTKLTFDGLDESHVSAARDAFIERLPEGALALQSEP
jgi:molybdenum cofactor synthesis domain-containing protein